MNVIVQVNVAATGVWPWWSKIIMISINNDIRTISTLITVTYELYCYLLAGMDEELHQIVHKYT